MNVQKNEHFEFHLNVVDRLVQHVFHVDHKVNMLNLHNRLLIIDLNYQQLQLQLHYLINQNKIRIKNNSVFFFLSILEGRGAMTLTQSG
jgi:hypothetical protein